MHNLRDVHVEIPRNTLTVITGLSGSGKSSLAFDTIYAEGQRRYVETLSPYARQFLDQMERPDVDSIEGLSPALSIEQKTTSRSRRSTVGTVTEIYDYLRLLYASIGTPHCPDCDVPIQSQPASQIAEQILHTKLDQKIMVMAPVVRGRKGEFRREFERYAQLGFVRARVDGEIVDLEQPVPLDRRRNHTVEVIVDRLKVRVGIESRLERSIEQATELTQGLVLIAESDGEERLYSQQLACVNCGRSLPEFEPRSFSFNSPYGACPECNGLGSKWRFDPAKFVENPSKPLLKGALPSALLPSYNEYDIRQAAKKRKVNLSRPVAKLDPEEWEYILWGDLGKNAKPTRAPRSYPGLIYLLEKLVRDYIDSEEVPDWTANYMTPQPCPECNGARLRGESLAVRLDTLNIAELAGQSIERTRDFVAGLHLSERQRQIAGRIVDEIVKRLNFLGNVGLDYLSLDRSAASISGGEAQRVRLATQIGSKLRGVLYVLDEPSIGLHARDNSRLLTTLEQLRDLGNTVLVVEHDQETIERADHVVDLGPAAGRLGGEIVAEGKPADIANAERSLTGAYLSGEKEIEVPATRRTGNGQSLKIHGARQHNLRDISVEFPLGTFLCITGVSGSGKSTLVNEILYPKLAAELYRSNATPGEHDRIDGIENVDKVIRIDQSPIGRTPRSNPATYTGTFTPIREFFSMLPESRARGYKPGRFSFNVKGGRCEACQGDGLKRIEMNFLPDVFVTCDVCRGRRYNQETLEVRYKGHSIADLLEMSVEDALPLMENLPKVHAKLKTLVDVGLGYIHLGQSSTTLSGGEAQRIKLSKELSKRQTGSTLYLLDEPTTGLHFDDVRKLVHVLQKLTDLGNTVLVIEHNVDVIKCADWIIDLGPDGGEHGGQIVAEGAPEDIAGLKRSHTGQALKKAIHAAKK